MYNQEDPQTKNNNKYKQIKIRGDQLIPFLYFCFFCLKELL
jgi:hypothetical protein